MTKPVARFRPLAGRLGSPSSPDSIQPITEAGECHRGEHRTASLTVTPMGAAARCTVKLRPFASVLSEPKDLAVCTFPPLGFDWGGRLTGWRCDSTLNGAGSQKRLTPFIFINILCDLRASVVKFSSDHPWVAPGFTMRAPPRACAAFFHKIRWQFAVLIIQF